MNVVMRLCNVNQCKMKKKNIIINRFIFTNKILCENQYKTNIVSFRALLYTPTRYCLLHDDWNICFRSGSMVKLHLKLFVCLPFRNRLKWLFVSGIYLHKIIIFFYSTFIGSDTCPYVPWRQPLLPLLDFI